MFVEAYARILSCIAVYFGSTIVVLGYWDYVLGLLVDPLESILGYPIQFTVAGEFAAYYDFLSWVLVLIGGLYLSLPYMMFQWCLFLAPSLYMRGRVAWVTLSGSCLSIFYGSSFRCVNLLVPVALEETLSSIGSEVDFDPHLVFYLEDILYSWFGLLLRFYLCIWMAYSSLHTPSFRRVLLEYPRVIFIPLVLLSSVAVNGSVFLSVILKSSIFRWYILRYLLNRFWMAYILEVKDE